MFIKKNLNFFGIKSDLTDIEGERALRGDNFS